MRNSFEMAVDQTRSKHVMYIQQTIKADEQTVKFMSAFNRLSLVSLVQYQGLYPRHAGVRLPPEAHFATTTVNLE
jgi:hypothetical protein